MLSGPQDRLNAIVEINAGAGGTESQDWRRCCSACTRATASGRDGKSSSGTSSPAKKRASRTPPSFARGDHSYGWLKAEWAVHRLVRISPFDANARRHTSFASVFVYPEVDEDIEIDINPSDVRIDTFRASGRGGPESQQDGFAIRMTHVPRAS